MTADALTFPSVSPTQLQLSQLLCSRQNQFSFPLAEQPCELKLQPADSPPPMEYSLILEVSGQPVEFYLGRGLVNALLPASLSDQAIKKLPEHLFKATMIHGLSPVTELIGSMLGTSVEFIHLKQTKADQSRAGLALHLTINHKEHSAFVVPNPLIMELLNYLPAHTQSTMPDIPIWAELILGRSTVSRLEISTLATGDIVFLQQHVTDQQVVVRASPHLAFVGETHDSQVIIRQRMELMDEQEHQQHPEEAQAPQQGGVNMADIPVELLFEIGRQQFSAADIQAMQEGYTFDLERPVDQPVRIRANGKIIAECQLIQIENRLGARITQLHK